MSYSGKVNLKTRARHLRSKGSSVREIQRQLQISKSSASIWTRDIILTKKQIKKLYENKRTGQIIGSRIAAENKMQNRINLTQELIKQGINQIGPLSRRDRFIAGVALYFAEGTKADKSVAFTNSSPHAILFMKNWLTEFCSVPKNKFRCSVYLHDNLDENLSKKYWSDLVNIPFTQFTKTYSVKTNPKRYRKTVNPNGVLRLTVNNVNLHRKIMGWISGLFKL